MAPLHKEHCRLRKVPFTIVAIFFLACAWQCLGLLAPAHLVSFLFLTGPQEQLGAVISSAQNAIAKRIRQIDHIPLSPAERREWTLAAQAFMQWLADQAVEHQLTCKFVYSVVSFDL